MAEARRVGFFLHRVLPLLLLAGFSAPIDSAPGAVVAERSMATTKPPATIDWQSGLDTGLAQAAKRNKPVFLYFQAHWCSWCHLYERDTLSAPGVTWLLRQNFVPIRINADARPDLLMKYGGFGLPYTVILSAGGRPLARLPGILDPGDLQDILQQLDNARNQAQPENTGPQAVETRLQVSRLNRQAYRHFLAGWLAYLDDLHDETSRRFSGVLESGVGLKRPATQTWIWLLESGRWPRRTREAALATLHQLYDADNGGFFFFDDPHRSDEHLETAKLVDANARLIHWFALAAGQYDVPAFGQAARAGTDYLLRVLRDPVQGGFFQAQLADAQYYQPGSQPRGPARRPPDIDRIKRTDSNARAAIALIETAGLQHDTRLRQAAIATVEFLLQQHLQNDRLYHSSDAQGLGPVYNLPEDIFYLLAAIQALKQAEPQWQVPQSAQTVYRLAGRWLASAMQQEGDDETVSSYLAGLVAWVSVNGAHEDLPRQSTPWALRQVRLTGDTRPDDLVYALRAWERYLRSASGF